MLGTMAPTSKVPICLFVGTASLSAALFFPSVLRLFLARKCLNTQFKNKHVHAMQIKLKSSMSIESHSHSPCRTLKTHCGVTHFSHHTHRQSRCCQMLGFCSGNGSLIRAKHSGCDSPCQRRHRTSAKSNRSVRGHACRQPRSRRCCLLLY